ncbi:MAG: O-antigen ligase family protein [Solirubrobacteraceae bacterium]|nr:O-antigen ligase family protein [Solirubrobacteraceae bacterium]
MTAAPVTPARSPSWPLVAGAAVLLIVAAVAVTRWYTVPAPQFLLLTTLVGLAGLAAVATGTHPAILLSAGIVLSPLAGNWAYLGLPQFVAPDRMLIAVAVLAAVLRVPAVRDRPPLRIGPAHVVLGAYAAYVVLSALVWGTLFADPLRVIDRMGLSAFAVFLVAPLIFFTERDRRVFGWMLVALGGYLAVTAVMESTAARGFVVPAFIADPALGIHFGRARGPFLDAATNAFAMFSCATAALIMRGRTDDGRLRALCLLVIAGCALGVLLSLQRSAWVGASLATLLTFISFRELRPWLLPALVVGVLGVCAAFTFVPGLSTAADTRANAQGSVWDRQNLNAAAVNMFLDRPLIGHGWDTFERVGNDFFWQGADYPLTAQAKTGVHNVVLARLSELGLIGTTLWIVGIGLALLSGLVGPRSPALRPWRIGLFALSVYFVVLLLVTPMAGTFTLLLLLTWAGLAAGPAALGRVADSTPTP